MPRHPGGGGRWSSQESCRPAPQISSPVGDSGEGVVGTVSLCVSQASSSRDSSTLLELRPQWTGQVSELRTKLRDWTQPHSCPW